MKIVITAVQVRVVASATALPTHRSADGAVAFFLLLPEAHFIRTFCHSDGQQHRRRADNPYSSGPGRY